MPLFFLRGTLKGVTDIGVWEFALNQLASRSSHQQEYGMSQVMVRVLKFFWHQDSITKRYIKNFTDCQKWSADSLVSSWIKNGLVETEENGKVIIQELINSFLLENLDNGRHVKMHKEALVVLRHFRQRGLGLTETPRVEDWFYFEEIELINNKSSKLPEKPECLFLQKLLLHNL
ncbi:hypothetical protein HYC85_009899 [Camellia sinensis]|uniref:Uncharacterized protein n=1 Tax=Camellia sinensis TaxID=4442 RepID=A0A7J7HH94_CAMSI|nr:hypothetical protein HYC85_009899 [Camellia sinensis]